ncbi:MAG: DEAD/DEAH box helicase [Oscillospiraceae bacterium]|nr:DEAD/DEAH box helicase [Oscillospiraceae bacterium]
MITHFEQFQLSPELMRALTKMKFQTPSPVQAAAISPMLTQQDLLVQAPTGTGKTAAFGIPIIEKIDPANRHIQTVILCPTRELAMQTTAVLKQLTAFKPGILVLALYGGEPIYHQVTALKRRPQIIVATPGRLIDHMKRRTTRLGQVDCIVLDEADRMLDMGFRDDIAHILQTLPTERQTVLFSATVSKEIKNIAATYQVDAQEICIEQETLPAHKIKQYYAEIPRTAKLPALLHLLDDQNFKLCLVFVATKSMADTLAQQLTAAGRSAEAIHGDLHQRQRNKVMQRYRSGKISLLVATDVAARGIDVDGIDAVINYDIPGDPDSYIHRIGRTGRADRTGIAYTLIDAKERGKLKNIITSTKAEIVHSAGVFGQFAKQEAHNLKQAASKKPARRRNYHAPHKRKRPKAGGRAS